MFITLPHEVLRALCAWLSFVEINVLAACCRALATDCASGRLDGLRRLAAAAEPLLPVEVAWYASSTLRPTTPGFATLRYRTIGRRRFLAHAEHDPRLGQRGQAAAVVRAACDWRRSTASERRWFEWYVEQVVRPPRPLGAIVAAWVSLLGSVRGARWAWERVGHDVRCIERRSSSWHLVGVLTVSAGSRPNTRPSIWPCVGWSRSTSAKVVAALEARALQSLASGPSDSIHL